MNEISLKLNKIIELLQTRENRNKDYEYTTVFVDQPSNRPFYAFLDLDPVLKRMKRSNWELIDSIRNKSSTPCGNDDISMSLKFRRELEELTNK